MQYTCPMHPEIIQDRPGRCPKCGMDLVSVKKKRMNTQEMSRGIPVDIDRARNGANAVKIKKIFFGIGGMHCASCVLLNEKSIKEVRGVQDASVNFAMRNANVTFDEAVTNEKEIYAAVEQGGYRVESMDDASMRHEHARREVAMAKRTALWAVVLAGITVVLAMANIQFGVSVAGRDFAVVAQMALSAIVIFGFGREFHIGMFKKLRRLQSDMDTLVSLGTIAAFAWSVYGFIIGSTNSYFETGAVIAALILLGRYFEAKSRCAAGEAV